MVPAVRSSVHKSIHAAGRCGSKKGWSRVTFPRAMCKCKAIRTGGLESKRYPFGVRDTVGRVCSGELARLR
jgi:hypothetical protein